ncbi:MAG: hypothetical protein GF346_11535, partial [Candidatus Eisenbacteria bacterium]|nr:hypothetical protein [Candidatus Latescibacterota bacterium]MBD3303068.1 hypothetical protein [Candidatus Eisenbacteria bacterium]
AAIATRVAGYASRYPSPEAFRSALQSQGMTEQEFRETMGSDLAIRRYLEATLPDTSTVGPGEARAFYDQNPQLFQTGQRYHARHIFLAAPRIDETATETERAADERARSKADSLLAALRAGADFEALAREWSEDETAQRGGDLGEFGRGAMVPGLQGIYDLQEGETSEVLRSPSGYHIFRMEERLSSEPVPYGPQLEARLVDQLRSEQQGRAVQQRLEELRAEATIERTL